MFLLAAAFDVKAGPVIGEFPSAHRQAFRIFVETVMPLAEQLDEHLVVDNTALIASGHRPLEATAPEM